MIAWRVRVRERAGIGVFRFQVQVSAPLRLPTFPFPVQSCLLMVVQVLSVVVDDRGGQGTQI